MPRKVSASSVSTCACVLCGGVFVWNCVCVVCCGLCFCTSHLYVLLSISQACENFLRAGDVCLNGYALADARASFEEILTLKDSAPTEVISSFYNRT